MITLPAGDYSVLVFLLSLLHKHTHIYFGLKAVLLGLVMPLQTAMMFSMITSGCFVANFVITVSLAATFGVRSAQDTVVTAKGNTILNYFNRNAINEIHRSD